MDPGKHWALFLGSRAERSVIGSTGAGEDVDSQGTDGKLGFREGDLVFPRSHHVPRDSRPAAAELYISQSHGVTLFHLEGGLRCLGLIITITETQVLNPELWAPPRPVLSSHITATHGRGLCSDLE